MYNSMSMCHGLIAICMKFEIIFSHRHQDIYVKRQSIFESDLTLPRNNILNGLLTSSANPCYLMGKYGFPSDSFQFKYLLCTILLLIKNLHSFSKCY